MFGMKWSMILNRLGRPTLFEVRTFGLSIGRDTSQT